MFFGDDLTGTVFIVMVAVATGGIIFAVIYPMLAGSASSSRFKAVAGNQKVGTASLRSRFAEAKGDSRRKQIQETLNQISEKENKKKQRLTLRVRLEQAGLETTPRTFYVLSVLLGLILTVVSLMLGAPLYILPVVAFVGIFGLPRWILKNICKRRQSKFLHDFADAIDLVVRGLKTGLPVTEAMKIIASEQGPPVGPEFREVVEGQRVGIPIDQGIERMTERMPLPEVNFLAIVMTIQSKTGGNLSEALSNLSRVLRDRKKMKQKIQSISQEAKSSATIIGSLPFCICGLISFLNPNYMRPLVDTHIGHLLLIGSGIWMSMGILVMRHLINFKL